MYKNELQHYGMPKRSGRYPYGSGERPYQGEGGPLKKLLKKKKKSEVTVTRRSGRAGGKSSSSDQNKNQEQPKNIKQMSEEELVREINRLNLEKQYQDLFRAVNPSPKVVSKGRSEVAKLLGEIAKSSVRTVGTQLATYALGELVNKAAKKNIIHLNVEKKDKKK